jgi:hypothetical protein
MQDLLLSDLQISEERIKIEKSLQDINTIEKKKQLRVKITQTLSLLRQCALLPIIKTPKFCLGFK